MSWNTTAERLRNKGWSPSMPEAEEAEHLWHTGISLDAGLMVKSRVMQDIKPDSLNSLSGFKLIVTIKDKIQRN